MSIQPRTRRVVCFDDQSIVIAIYLIHIYVSQYYWFAVCHFKTVFYVSYYMQNALAICRVI